MNFVIWRLFILIFILTTRTSCQKQESSSIHGNCTMRKIDTEIAIANKGGCRVLVSQKLGKDLDASIQENVCNVLCAKLEVKEVPIFDCTHVNFLKSRDPEEFICEIIVCFGTPTYIHEPNATVHEKVCPTIMDPTMWGTTSAVSTATSAAWDPTSAISTTASARMVTRNGTLEKSDDNTDGATGRFYRN